MSSGGTNHSVYYRENEEDEELKEWVEEYEGVLGGRSNLYKRAVKVLRNEKGAELESLADVDDNEMLT